MIVFFVLSGYWVGGPAYRRMRQGSFALSPYIIARLSRLYVVLLPTMLAAALLVAIGSRIFPESKVYVAGAYNGVAGDPTRLSDPGTILGNLIFLQDIRVGPYAGNGPLWSLAYEFWFYTLLPILFGLFSRRLRTRLTCALLAVLVMVLVGTRVVMYESLWLLGGLAYVCCMSNWWRSWNFRIPRSLVVAIASALLIGAVAASYVGSSSFLIDLGLGLIMTAFLLALGQGKAVPGGWIARIATPVSNISFSLYAVHLPIVQLLAAFTDHLHLDASVRFGASILGALIAATLVYYTFERHTPRVRRTVTRIYRRIVERRRAIARRGLRN